MNVGILTQHFGTNYGGTLQCLALQTAVEALGHEVDVIDYRPYPRVLPLWRGWRLGSKKLAYVYPRLLQLRYGRQSLQTFDRFRSQHMRFSMEVKSLAGLRQIAPCYDAIITGSDQVWNFRGPDAYFLPLGSAYTGRKIAYAACCSQESQPMDRSRQVGEWIRDYDAISVRDAFSKSAVEYSSGRTPSVVCDPTMLMDAAWLADRNEDACHAVILIYRLGEPMSGDYSGFIRLLQSRLKNPRIKAIVAAASNPIRCPEADDVRYDASPYEWMASLRTSCFLVTDSYHGVLFALKSSVPFVAYYTEPGRAPRLLDLQERFALGNRIVGNAREATSVMESCLAPPTINETGAVEWIGSSRLFLRTALAS